MKKKRKVKCDIPAVISEMDRRERNMDGAETECKGWKCKDAE